MLLSAKFENRLSLFLGFRTSNEKRTDRLDRQNRQDVCLSVTTLFLRNTYRYQPEIYIKYSVLLSLEALIA